MPDVFEIADLHVALGGDSLNTVPRFGVTAAEIAVLQVIHGSDAVHDITPRGTIERPQRVERQRLAAVYGSARDRDGRLHVETLYPGAAARVFEKIDELELGDTQFKVIPQGRIDRSVERMQAADAAALLVEQSNQNQPVPDVDAEDRANGLEELPGDPVDEHADEAANPGALG